MGIALLILGFVMFVGLIIVHELGHFFAARRSGVEVEEFGIGFPPKAWSKKLKSGLVFSINWLPLGGFVRLKGENDSDKRPGSFGAARLKHKIYIMLAGVGMNVLAAVGLFTLAAWAGMPQLIDKQFTVASDARVVRQDVLVGQVISGSPAEAAGLKERDVLISIGPVKGVGWPEKIDSAKRLADITAKYSGGEVTIDYARGGSMRSTTVTLRSAEEVEASQGTDQPKGYLGVSPGEYTLVRSTWSAPIVGGGLAAQFTSENIKGLGQTFGKLLQGKGQEASEQVAGPIGVVRLIFDSSTLGIQAILLIMGYISITLALMNILPIPALDGGRLFITLLYRSLNKTLKKETEELIHGAGFLVLISLILLVSIVDVKRLF